MSILKWIPQEAWDKMELEDNEAMNWMDEFRNASPERQKEMSQEEEDKEAKLWVEEFLSSSSEGKRELLKVQDRVKYREVSNFLKNLKDDTKL